MASKKVNLNKYMGSAEQRMQSTQKRVATKQRQASLAATKAASKPGAIKSTVAASKQKAFTKSPTQTAIRNISNETGMKRGAVTKMAVDGKNSNYKSSAYKTMRNDIAEGDTKTAKRIESQLKKANKKK